MDHCVVHVDHTAVMRHAQRRQHVVPCRINILLHTRSITAAVKAYHPEIKSTGLQSGKKYILKQEQLENAYLRQVESSPDPKSISRIQNLTGTSLFQVTFVVKFS